MGMYMHMYMLLYTYIITYLYSHKISYSKHTCTMDNLLPIYTPYNNAKKTSDRADMTVLYILLHHHYIILYTCNVRRSCRIPHQK